MSGIRASSGIWLLLLKSMKPLAKSDQTGFELFNLAVDPRETSDQATHEPELFQRLKKMLVEYDNEVLQEGPDWWSHDGVAKEMPFSK